MDKADFQDLDYLEEIKATPLIGITTDTFQVCSECIAQFFHFFLIYIFYAFIVLSSHMKMASPDSRAKRWQQKKHMASYQKRYLKFYLCQCSLIPHLVNHLILIRSNCPTCITPFSPFSVCLSMKYRWLKALLII